MSYTSASNLLKRDFSWIKSLSFYDNELDILEGRLAEVAGKNNSFEARSGVEHFQNQFIVQRNNIDELKHEIKVHDHLVYEDARQHAGRVEIGLVVHHTKIEDGIKIFEKVITDLRKEFYAFASKWM